MGLFKPDLKESAPQEHVGCKTAVLKTRKRERCVKACEGGVWEVVGFPEDFV